MKNGAKRVFDWNRPLERAQWCVTHLRDSFKDHSFRADMSLDSGVHGIEEPRGWSVRLACHCTLRVLLYNMR